MPLISTRLVAGLIVVAVAALILTSPVLAAPICGKASWYGHAHHGRATASGEIFDQWAMTAARPSRSELGKRYRVTAGGKSVVVRITDTGGFAKYGRVIDLSRSAFGRLAHTDKGVINVCMERVR